MHVGVGGPGAVFWIIVAGFLRHEFVSAGEPSPFAVAHDHGECHESDGKSDAENGAKNGAGAGTRRPIVALSGHLVAQELDH